MSLEPVTSHGEGQRVRTQKTSSVQGAALGDKEVGSWPWSSRLLCDLGQVSSLLWASVCPCVKQGGETHSFGSLFLRCICGSWGAARPPPARPGLVWVGSAGRAGWRHGEEQGCWPECVSTEEQPLSGALQCLGSRTTARGWGPRCSPKGRSESVWERGIRGLRPDGSRYPSLARSAKAAVDAGNCSLAGGREGGGESRLGPRERQRREN